MRAMVIERFGGPEVLTLRDLERPEPGPGELLVRVVASGTNPVDAKIRAHGTWARIPLPAVLGYDASGVVESYGPGVTGFSPGDEVYFTPEIFGNGRGTYAEYTTVRADIVAHKPKSLSHVEAAAIPLACGTAWEAVVRRLAVHAGETVLVHGGVGGVGSFAVQIAKASGARVIASAGTSHQQTLRELGVDVPVDYTKEKVADVALRETSGEGVDAVFDTVGGDLVAQSVPVTRPFGRLATILPPNGELSALSTKNLTLYGVFLTRERRRLEEIARVVDRGLIEPIVDRVLPLERVREAHERLDSGHGRGKIVLELAKA